MSKIMMADKCCCLKKIIDLHFTCKFNPLRYELTSLSCLTLSFGEKQKGILGKNVNNACKLQGFYLFFYPDCQDIGEQ